MKKLDKIAENGDGEVKIFFSYNSLFYLIKYTFVRNNKKIKGKR